MDKPNIQKLINTGIKYNISSRIDKKLSIKSQ